MGSPGPVEPVVGRGPVVTGAVVAVVGGVVGGVPPPQVSLPVSRTVPALGSTVAAVPADRNCQS